LIQNTQVIVKDTSTAIDPTKLPQLISKFASKSFEDTGLGLFVAKSIETHHGKVWAKDNIINTHREKASTFTLLYQLSIDNKMKR
jgi:signal transduction histidine kinase